MPTVHLPDPNSELAHLPVTPATRQYPDAEEYSFDFVSDLGFGEATQVLPPGFAAELSVNL
jgi:hypothetical protein